MFRVRARVFAIVGLFVLMVAALGSGLWLGSKRRSSNPKTPGKTLALTQNHSVFPIYFEPNVGQAEPGVRYFSNTGGYTLSISRTGAALVVIPQSEREDLDGKISARSKSDPPSPRRVVSIELRGARRDSTLAAQRQLGGRVSYLIGNDPAKWRTDIPIYERIVQRGVWPGIDLVYHAGARGLEYDFIVRPGANPEQVALSFDGIDRPEIAPDGDLIVHSGDSEVRMLKPSVYQERGGQVPIDARYVWSGEAGRRNASQP